MVSKPEIGVEEERERSGNKGDSIGGSKVWGLKRACWLEEVRRVASWNVEIGGWGIRGNMLREAFRGNRSKVTKDLERKSGRSGISTKATGGSPLVLSTAVAGSGFLQDCCGFREYGGEE